MKLDTRANPLQVLLDQVWALRPNWENPEKFHECKSDIVAGLKRLIVESGTLPEAALTAAAEKTEPVFLPAAPPVDDVSAESNAAVDEPAADPPGSAEDLGQSSSTPLVVAPNEDPVADLIALRRVIKSTVAAVADVLADVEKLSLSARASVVVYATALTVPPQSPVPAIASPTPTDTEPQTFYRRSHLLTDEGRAIATRLWVDGLTKRDIAECFDYHGNTGPACVSAAIASFLHTHYPREIAVSVGERGKELAQRALLSIDTRPGHGNEHTKPPAPPARLPSQPTSPAAEFIKETNAGGSELTLPTLPPAHYLPADLKTPSGRATAAELWAAGYGQRVVGQHFGLQNSCEPHVSLAVSAFIREHLGPFRAAGEARKPLIRKALIKFRESGAAAAE